MIRYKVKKYVNKKSTSNGYFYAVPHFTETLDINALAKHMATHNTPYSQGAIRGILTDAVACIRELCLDGKKVKLENLAIFSIGFKSTLQEDAKKANADSIARIHLNARGTGDFSGAQLNLDRSLRAYDEYNTGVNQKDMNQD